MLKLSSRFDYCNALFIGLQYIQNSAVRILTHAKCSAHITPILYDLHWLPVAYHLKFKILLLAFKSLHGLAPPYPCNMLVPYTRLAHYVPLTLAFSLSLVVS